jgi:hypothetical protein
VEKKDIYKSIILSKLNLCKKIGARKTVVKEVTTDEAKQFCNKNHLHGYVNSSYKIGLFLDNELISIMTFGIRKISKGNKKLELLRYCSKLDHQIIGGFSKLFVFAQKIIGFDELITYSYNDLGINTVYEKNNFVKTNINKGYFYIVNNKRYHRWSFQKSKLIKLYGEEVKNMSEKEIMRNKGHLLCYDSGSTLYKWKNQINN